MLFDDPLLVPQLSLLDAELLVHCGPALTAVTGIRSIVGCVEALLSRRRNPFTTTLALEAIALMRGSLEQTARDPHDVDARERSLYSAVMGTMATSNAGVTGAHAAGLIIGGRYGAPHGVPHAILLPPIMRAFDTELEPHAPALANALGAGAGSAAAAFEDLVRAGGMATRLRDIGIPHADLTEIAAQTATLPMMQNAPRAVDAAEIHAWLEAVW
jgi:alcohol dehydrogenase class IV